MKVLFLTDNFFPETNAPAYRTYEHMKQWVDKGEEVTVITCAPNFPYGKVYEGYRNKLYQVEIVDGIKVIRVWSYMAENKGFVKRVLDFVSFMISSFIVGLFVKTDLIIATSPQFFAAISGRWLAFWKRKNWVMEVRDLWPESIKAVGVMNDNVVIRFFEYLEHGLYKNAWKIVTVTEYMKDVIVNNHNISESKVRVIRNGVDFKLFNPMPKDTNLISELYLENKFIIGYVGTHGMAHALDFVLKSASKIDNKRIHFLFVGNGAAKPSLLLLKDELKLDNVTFIDPVSKDQVKKYLSILDVGLVTLIDSPIFFGALPSKMNELIAMKIPILLGLKGEAEDFIIKNNLGLNFIPEDETSFLNAINNIANNIHKSKIDLEKMGGIIDRNKLAIKMLNFIKE